MANGFGSLYVGSSGMQTAQNGLNVIANNLSNVNTTGYVRQQVIYADKSYNPTQQKADISIQQVGLGVDIGDVVHARDVFLDRAYRTQNGRESFYEASYDATSEVETFLQEMDGADFKTAMNDLYVAFSEFAKYPDDAAYQNLVVQKAELFISRSQAVYNGLKEYQSTINTKISDDVERINELADNIKVLNVKIQQIEAAGVETAMSYRDERDLYLDELSGLADITYNEQYNGVVTVKLEGQDFITESRYNRIALKTDQVTGFVTPYWPHLSQPDKDDYYEVFNLDRVSADTNSDRGEIKAMLLARGDHYANYTDFDGLDSFNYEKGLGNSVMLNSQAEMDLLIHNIVTAVNDLFAPKDTLSNVYTDLGLTDDTVITASDTSGRAVYINKDTLVCDVNNSSVGSDNQMPPQELFSRTGTERFTEVTFTHPVSGETVTAYVYNTEHPSERQPVDDTLLDNDTSQWYTMNSIRVNDNLVVNQSLLPHRTITQNENQVDYTLGKKLADLWTNKDYLLNPSDDTPSTFQEFYAKFVGELGTNGNIFKATMESYASTVKTIEENRQQVVGVSSDEELTTMIKYQNAYNASSRFINVVNSMIDYLLSSLT